MPPRLAPLDFENLAGFLDDDCLAAYRCFERSARSLVEGRAGARPARPPSPALIAVARAALDGCVSDRESARRFFERRFRPFRILGEGSSAPTADGFLTGYYEPHVAGSRERTDEFRWPLLARPADLTAFAPAEAPGEFPPGVSGARRSPDSSLVAYDDRAAIEKAQRDPIVWVRDAAEAFLIQVQGSAQVEFADGRRNRSYWSEDSKMAATFTSMAS